MTDRIWVTNDFNRSTDRVLKVYQHSSGETVSITYSATPTEREKDFSFADETDYLEISVKDPHVHLRPSRIDLSSRRLHSLNRGTRNPGDIREEDDRITKTYRIKEGLPTWKLKIQSHLASGQGEDAYGDHGEENVTVGDDGPGGGGQLRMSRIKKDKEESEKIEAYEESMGLPVFSLLPYTVLEVIVSPWEVIDWGLKMLSIPPWWEETQGDGIKVAVLDTGIDSQHLDLSDAIVGSEDFTGSKNGTADMKGHGTHVAGIIAARRGNGGVVGLAPQAELLIGKVLGDNGQGTSEMVESGIRWAIEQKADIINMSLGSLRYSKPVHDAVSEAVKRGIFVICAAGNKGPFLDTVLYPGKLNETVAVGAIDQEFKIWRRSSRGKQVDIVAPGYRVRSAYPPQKTAVLSGTSMAAPFVSGVVALMLAKHRGTVRNETPLENQEQLKEHLEKTAVDLGEIKRDPLYGWGLVNPEKLLYSHSSRVLNLSREEDLTESGKRKLNEFAGGKIRPTADNETYIEGSMRDGVGEIRGGIRIDW
jgi:subtilisin family serine protease